MNNGYFYFIEIIFFSRLNCRKADRCLTLHSLNESKCKYVAKNVSFLLSSSFVELPCLGMTRDVEYIGPDQVMEDW